MPLAQSGERIQIGSSACHMDCHDGPRARRDGRLHGHWVDAQALWIDVDQHGCGIHGERGRCRCEKGDARHDDLVALPDIARGERCLERVRAVSQREPKPSPVVGGELGGERGCLRSIALPPAAMIQYAEQSIAFAIVPHWP